MKWHLHCLIILIFSFSSTLQADNNLSDSKQTDDNNLAKRIEQHIQSYVEQESFSGTVLIAKSGEIIYHGAFGQRDQSTAQDNTIDTAFLIGSITKSFTATTIMQLYEAGKLDLHHPIAHYLPDIKPEFGQSLTLHHLLKHQSGLPSHLERLVEFEDRTISSEEILQIINSSQLAFEPGTRYQYSNLNYHLAAIIIENISGNSYADTLNTMTFTQLGMKDSGVERNHTRPSHRAKGYRKTNFGIRPDENIMDYTLGSGDIYSTAQDLLLWDQALYGNEYLSPKSKTLLFTPENEDFGNYGYGFRIQPYQRALPQPNTGTLIRHGGSMNGFLANLHRYIDDQLTVIVLANIRNFPIRQLSFELKELALAVPLGQRERRPIE